MNKELYSKYIQSTTQVGSNKAVSYVRALDLLCLMLEVKPFSFQDCINIWSVDSAERIHELYEFVLLERRKGAVSPWNIQGIPDSYLRDGFCSAALRSYEVFLIEKDFEQHLFDVFDSYEGDEFELPNSSAIELNLSEHFIDSLESKEGKDVVRAMKSRVNQNVFRKIILLIYNQSCCITGLNIPDVNRASHIVRWADNAENRLDPTNGLCLSATYDAAFDRNFISLDDDYRIILSKNIRDYATNESVREYFLKKEGHRIKLPNRFRPNKDYLEEHRKHGEY